MEQKVVFSEEYKKGYADALKELNIPQQVIMEKWEASQCPRCKKYYDDYEEPNDGYYTRATDLERCPFCGQKLKWLE